MMKTYIKHTLVILFLFNTQTLLAVTEQQIKTAYIYNITKFVKWPKNLFDSEKSSINICIIGKNSFKKELESLRDKKVSNRTLELNYFDNTKNTDKCHIAYLSSSRKNILKNDLKSMKEKSILTISGIYMFAEKGGMVELRNKNNKIKLYINTTVVNKHDISLSSKILELSNIIKSPSYE